MEEWTFGTYQVKSLIGRGGMGEVYRAFDTSHDRMVALKLLAAHLSQDESYRARFRRECHLAARLREPHVIPIHSYGETDGRLFLDMRLVEGRDLGDVLSRQGAMPPRRAVDIIGQVARALDAAHDDGLIHRDVKPSNVIIAEEDDVADADFVFVYLVDFGVARAVGDDGNSNALTQTGGAVGTFDYMPPERFAGVIADRQTDVYALTCMLFECLTGQRPFTGADLPSLMYAHMNAVPPSVSRLNRALSPSMDAVIARGMAKDPAARYPTAGAMAAAARAALRESGGTPSPISTPAPPTRTDDRGRGSEVRTAWPSSGDGAPPTLGPTPFYQPPAGFSGERAMPAQGQVAGQVAGQGPGQRPSTPLPASAPGLGSAPNPWSSPGPLSGPTSGPTSGPVSGPEHGAGSGRIPYPSSGPAPQSARPQGPPPGGRPPVSGQLPGSGVLPVVYGPPNPPPASGPAGTWPGQGGIGGAGGSKRSRTPLIIAAVVVVALIASLAAVFATRGGSSKGDSTPTTSSGESGPSFGSSVVTTPAAQLDTALVNLLPDTYKKEGCEVGSIVDTKAVAALKCGESSDTANGPSVASFYRYPDVATLRADFANVIANNKLGQATAACPGVGYRDWHYGSTPTVVAGQLASYLNPSGSAALSWTVEEDLELVIAENFDPTKLPGLCTWWKDT